MHAERRVLQDVRERHSNNVLDLISNRIFRQLSKASATATRDDFPCAGDKPRVRLLRAQNRVTRKVCALALARRVASFEAGIKFRSLNSLSFNLIMKRCRSGDESQSWRRVKAFCFRACSSSLKIRRIVRSRQLALTGVYVFSSREFTRRLPPCFLSLLLLDRTRADLRSDLRNRPRNE